MEENEAVEEQGAATPIFAIYRRGYDPEQVDRYVLDHQRRLDESTHRASESERKLAAAVGQLRELHRRVAVYESEARSAQPPQLDTLGERVQRILQEAWEGAYNLRQEAEREVTDMREVAQRDVDALRDKANADVDELRVVASKEASDVVEEATRRALHIRDETERRRQAYLERVERDREQAISQITYLYDQRQCAIAELARLQASVQTTIEEMVHSPLGRPAPGVIDAMGDSATARRAGITGVVEAPQLPGIDIYEDSMDVLADEAPMERVADEQELAEVRSSARRTADEEADEIEAMMRSTEQPAAHKRSVSLGSEPTTAVPISPAPADLLGSDSLRPGAPTGGTPAVQPTMRPSSVIGGGPEDAVRRDEGGPRSARPSGTVIPRPSRDFAGPVGPRGSVPGGSISSASVGGPDNRQGSGVAHSVHTGLEAAKGMLRRPRQQGVYDAEQDDWG